MVLKTKSCSLLTVVSKSSPRAAMATGGAAFNCDNGKKATRKRLKPERMED